MSLRHIARDALARALDKSGVTRPSRRSSDHLSIATFHRVLPERERRAYPLPGIVVTPEELDFFLGYFAEHYTLGSLTELWGRYRAGERPESPFLALTFDDAQRDNLLHAVPVLDRHGVRASFYVPVDHVEEARPLWHDRLGFALLESVTDSELAEVVAASFGRAPSDAEDVLGFVEEAKDLDPEERELRVRSLEASSKRGIPGWAAMMSWDEVRRLADAGHEIGSHSRTHPILPQCDDARLEREIVGSRQILEAKLGREVTTFCYPNGDSDGRVAAVVERAGYHCAVTTRWGGNGSFADRLALKRWDMNAFHVREVSGQLSAPRLAWRISGLYPGLR